MGCPLWAKAPRNTASSRGRAKGSRDGGSIDPSGLVQRPEKES